MTPDPRLQQLAFEAAKKIKALTDERDEGIRRIYERYQQQAAAIRVESDPDGIERAPASPSELSPQSNSGTNPL